MDTRLSLSISKGREIHPSVHRIIGTSCFTIIIIETICAIYQFFLFPFNTMETKLSQVAASH